MAIAKRHRHITRGHVTGDGIFQHRDLTIQHSDIHFLPFPGFFPMIQGHHNSVSCKHAGNNVADRSSNTGRFAAFRTSNAHDAAHCLNNDIIGRFVLIRSAMTKARASGINDIRINCLQLVISQTELFHRPWTIIFQNDIRMLDHLFKKINLFLALEIQRHGTFIAVQAHEISTFLANKRTERPRIVSDFGRLNFHNVSAIIRQHHRTIRSGQHPGQVQHSQSCQWFHYNLSFNLYDFSMEQVITLSALY